MPFIIESKNYQASRFGQIARGFRKATARSRAEGREQQKLQLALQGEERAQEQFDSLSALRTQSLGIQQGNLEVRRGELEARTTEADAARRLGGLTGGGGALDPGTEMGDGMLELTEQVGGDPDAVRQIQEALDEASPKLAMQTLKDASKRRRERLEMQAMNEFTDGLAAYGSSMAGDDEDAQAEAIQSIQQRITPQNWRKIEKDLEVGRLKYNTHERSKQKADQTIENMNNLLMAPGLARPMNPNRVGPKGTAYNFKDPIEVMQDLRDASAKGALTDDQIGNFRADFYMAIEPALVSQFDKKVQSIRAQDALDMRAAIESSLRSGVNGKATGNEVNEFRKWFEEQGGRAKVTPTQAAKKASELFGRDVSLEMVQSILGG